MKRIILVSLLLLIVVLFLPLLIIDVSSGSVAQDDAPSGILEPSADEEPAASAEAGVESDENLMLTVQIQGQAREISMHDYLVGTVAAEMPVSFEKEALKAQAVAARTYALYKLRAAPSESHPDAGLCDNPACCQAYKTYETLAEQWGAAYEENLATIIEAVAGTDGVCIVYEDAPILAAFHAASSGRTEASADIWGDLPYLQSVQTFETEASVPNFYTSVAMTYEEFRVTILEAYPEAALDGLPAEWITGIVRSDTGRILSLSVGGVSLTGPAFRSLFALRSTAITVTLQEEGLILEVEGYGHGVGMSQYGANELARLGFSYEAILKWYYSGVSLASMDSLP